ncbi:MAG TPA: YcaO-like family protein, partial [Geminicoccaceae bacterium]|nr:YcaO-like family protein [Geminicoccaceae bacterium]
ELNQMAAIELAGDSAPAEHDDDPDLIGWLHTATIVNQPYVVPLEDQVTDAGDFEDQSSDDITADVRLCVERLRDLGHETLVLDHTRPDIGFPTARVIVPGLRHFWARFAPGRLYDIPASPPTSNRRPRDRSIRITRPMAHSSSSTIATACSRMARTTAACAGRRRW